MPALHSAASSTVIAGSSAVRRTLVLCTGFLLLCALPLLAVHATLLPLPFFWDEAGQFIPTALDLFQHGWWVTRTAIPNVHPPGVELYLVLWWKLFGYSIFTTRVAMLLCNSCALGLTFLLAQELAEKRKKAVAIFSSVLLFASPLFFVQSMLAQLDMPAAVWTLLVLLLFIRGHYLAAGIASIVLVLTKETGLVTPFVLFLVLLRRRDFKNALFFVPAAVFLAGWLFTLHRATGFWLGDPGFAHYNVGYSLHPVRIIVTLLRRAYYLFVAEFRFVGTLALVSAWPRMRGLVSQRTSWQIVLCVAFANVMLVSLLGGAELERYLLPVLPIVYISFAIALQQRGSLAFRSLPVVLLVGLAVNLFWNPPYPFPFENNFALVDFVRLQSAAAQYLQEHLPPDSVVATAWPYTAGFRDPHFGFVSHKLSVLETNDFDVASIKAIAPERFNTLVTYTRTWNPPYSISFLPGVHQILQSFYAFQPSLSTEQCEEMGLHLLMTISIRGQSVTIYQRSALPMERPSLHGGKLN